ncbi:hypothetical protein BDZ89DRAFT_350584 [Hymenopellis radicata]|nr:hypothetical protein BDZ89DRAFT_350584 [Hymenopellis radicata]
MDWDEEDTWTEWEVDKPRTTSFLFVSDLELTLSKSLGCGILMLMDFLASDEWSPFIDVDNLQIFAGGSAMTATTVIRINNLIRRYELSFLWLDDFTNFEDATGTPLHLGGVKCSEMDFSILEGFVFDELDEDRFEWYVESLAAVPPNSRLRQLTLRLTILVPLEAKDLGSQGVWGILDSALSGNNLQLATLIIDVSPTISPTCSKTRGLKELLETWLMKTCFPKVAAKYSRQNKETAGEKKTSLLALWIGGEQFYAKKQ